MESSMACSMQQTDDGPRRQGSVPEERMERIGSVADLTPALLRKISSGTRKHRETIAKNWWLLIASRGYRQERVADNNIARLSLRSGGY